MPSDQDQPENALSFKESFIQEIKQNPNAAERDVHRLLDLLPIERVFCFRRFGLNRDRRLKIAVNIFSVTEAMQRKRSFGKGIDQAIVSDSHSINTGLYVFKLTNTKYRLQRILQEVFY